MADQNGLGWEVNKINLKTQSGNDTPFFALERNDTKELFMSCRKNYVPFQTRELFQLADAISAESNLPIKTSRSLDGGRKVVLQLDNGKIDKIGKNADSIERYVTVVNSHDGTSSLRWGHSLKTFSCKNQFHQIGRSLDHSRHTKNMYKNIEESVRQIKLLQEAQALLTEQVIDLSHQQVTDSYVDDFLSSLVDIDMSLSEDELMLTHHGKKTNKAFAIRNAVKREMSYKGRNKWALLEGVTYYTTHEAGSDKKREVNKLTGVTAQLDAQAFRILRK